MATYDQLKLQNPDLPDSVLFSMMKQNNPTITRANFKTFKEAKPTATFESLGIDPALVPAYGTLMNYAQGASFGTLDDIVGLTRGQDAKQQFREAMSNYRKDAPFLLSTLPEIGGGLLTGGLGAKRLAESPIGKSALNRISQMSPVKRYATNLGIGGGTGAAVAIPYSEAESPQELLQDVGTGGLLGTAGAGLFAPLAAVGQSVAQKVMPSINRFASQIGFDPERAFGRSLARNLASDDITPEQIRTMAQTSDPNMMMADIPGTNVQQLADMYANLPGSQKTQALEALNTRARGAQERIMTEVSDAVGLDAPGVNFDAIQQQLLENMLKLQKPYEKVLDENIVEITPALKGLLNRPTMKSALARAKLIVQDEGKPDVDRFFIPSVDDATGQVKSFEIGERPTLHVFQKIKEGLDEMIDAQTDPVTGKIQGEGVRFVKLKKDLTDELEKITEYQEIKDLYATEKSAEKALEMGRKFMRQDSEVTERIFEGLSEADKGFFRLGAARQLDDIVQSRNIDAPPRPLTELNANRVRAVFGENADKIINRFETERMFARTKQKIEGGSPTQPRQEKLRSETGVDLVEAADRPVGFVRSLLTDPTNVIPPRQREIAAETLFQPMSLAEPRIRGLLGDGIPLVPENAAQRLQFDLTGANRGSDFYRGLLLGANPTIVGQQIR